MDTADWIVKKLFITRNMFFENKGMVTPTPSERAGPQPVHLNVGIGVDNNENQRQEGAANYWTWKNMRLSYLLNGCLATCVLALIAVAEYGYIPNTKLGFTCQDPSISYKFRGELVTPIVLGLGCFLIPLFVLVLTEILTKESFRRLDMSTLWYLYKECIINGTLILLFTQIGKVLVGEHRPHFLDVCEPDTANGCESGSYIEDYRCTSTKYSIYFLIDSSRSFPSGHSSLSVFVALFSAYVVHSRLPTNRTGGLLKPFLIAVCITFALVCSLSRVTDRRHHWWDVLAGMVLGALGAAYAMHLVHERVNYFAEDDPPTISDSTTTLLDIKNKDATSVII